MIFGQDTTWFRFKYEIKAIWWKDVNHRKTGKEKRFPFLGQVQESAVLLILLLFMVRTRLVYKLTWIHWETNLTTIDKQERVTTYSITYPCQPKSREFPTYHVTTENWQVLLGAFHKLMLSHKLDFWLRWPLVKYIMYMTKYFKAVSNTT